MGRIGYIICICVLTGKVRKVPLFIRPLKHSFLFFLSASHEWSTISQGCIAFSYMDCSQHIMYVTTTGNRSDTCRIVLLVPFFSSLSFQFVISLISDYEFSLTVFRTPTSSSSHRKYIAATAMKTSY
jgi:ABC-type uncharacterized transport system permease subunit